MEKDLLTIRVGAYLSGAPNSAPTQEKSHWFCIEILDEGRRGWRSSSLTSVEAGAYLSVAPDTSPTQEKSQ